LMVPATNSSSQRQPRAIVLALWKFDQVRFASPIFGSRGARPASIILNSSKDTRRGQHLGWIFCSQPLETSIHTPLHTPLQTVV
jgi:hypothetical protein